MAERERKHELVVVVGVRNIDKHEESDTRVLELDHSRSVTYENDPVQTERAQQTLEDDFVVSDEQQQDEDEEEDEVEGVTSSSQTEQWHPHKRYVNMGPLPGQPPEPASRKRYLEELAEEQSEEEDERVTDEGEREQPGLDYENEVIRDTQETQNASHSDRNQTQVLQQQMNLLRDLLRIERFNSEQRKQNNQALQKYVQQLQTDYLRQQSDLVQALEFAHKLKGQKESQLACVEASLKDKETLIEHLQAKLASLDDDKLRAEFNEALDKQQKLKQMEQEQLKLQIGALEHQLVQERANIARLQEQSREKLDDQARLHERELEAVRLRMAEAQEDLQRLLSEPQNLVIKALREDKSHLNVQVDELNLTLQETQAKCDSHKKRLDSLILEHERLEQQNQLELEAMQHAQAEQRRAHQEIKLELEDKEEVNQILQFNLSRSEKRVKNLLGSIKAKEATYRELISANDLKHQQEVEKLKSELQIAEKRIIEFESELTRKQNDLVRLQLEQENQLKSMRDDRDERLNRVGLEKAKLDRELKATEMRLAHEVEQSNQHAKQVEQVQHEMAQLREESKRLSIELTKSEAKLYAKQQEVQRISQKMEEQQEQLHQLMSDEQSAPSRIDQLIRELEAERNHTIRMKTNLDELRRDNEKLCVKLKIAETNIDKMSTTLNREHAKMMLEYEKRLEQIRSEQVVFEKNKLRYKRHGYKLKKYCDHLKRVHEHLCSPTNCGYMILSQPSEMVPSTLTTTSLALSGDRASLPNDSRSGSESDESASREAEEDIYEEILEDSIGKPSPGSKSRLSLASSKSGHSLNKFRIKRTGLPDVSPQTPVLHQRVPRRLSFRDDNAVPLNQPTPKAPLKVRQQQAESDDRHAYYYIRDDKRQTPSEMGREDAKNQRRQVYNRPRASASAANGTTRLSLSQQSSCFRKRI